MAAVLRAGPLPGKVAAALAEGGEDLPEDLARTLLIADPAGCAPRLAPRSAALANLALDLAPLEVPSGARRPGMRRPTWPELCVRRGLLTVSDLVARGRPAWQVLRRLQGAPLLRDRADTAVRDLFDRHGPLSADALLVVAVLADDFPGTLPELITTAVAATAV